ncbi:hypothetical protein [Leifsonia sp. Leaf264]|uniref:hypothetical protein n=1 Tax=Leifsonia sp. Leaf264 TaxID=1736314 RepID=UPI0006F9E42C|nr:hypothetical protein [Leifsonia sp. Leaf264]KQO98294.1 hypothetical protein ASF30_09550 [Leifsonia sp. Leaf264]
MNSELIKSHQRRLNTTGYQVNSVEATLTTLRRQQQMTAWRYARPRVIRATISVVGLLVFGVIGILAGFDMLGGLSQLGRILGIVFTVIFLIDALLAILDLIGDLGRHPKIADDITHYEGRVAALNAEYEVAARALSAAHAEEVAEAEFQAAFRRRITDGDLSEASIAALTNPTGSHA